MPLTRKVLVIEDDAALAKIVTFSLAKRGYEAVVVVTFETALELVRHNTFSFVLTDIFMDGMGGIEGIKRLTESHPDLPILAMSGGWVDMEPDRVIEAAIEIGADAGLKKPLAPADLDGALSAIGRGEHFNPDA